MITNITFSSHVLQAKIVRDIPSTSFDWKV